MINIQDNFLEEKEFNAIRDIVTAVDFPWYFKETTVPASHFDISEEIETTSGLFSHTIYTRSLPRSDYFHSMYSLLDRINVEVLLRIKLNLQHRLTKPGFCTFHSDTATFEENIAAQWTTSLFYINTNNGYTEVEGGQRIESVANRLASWPSNIKHRGVTQTDEQTRIVINLNYLKV